MILECDTTYSIMINARKRNTLDFDFLVQIVAIPVLLFSYLVIVFKPKFITDLLFLKQINFYVLCFLGFYNPLFNLLQVVLGSYSEKIRATRMYYFLAILLYFIIGIVFIVSLSFKTTFFFEVYYLLTVHLFAITYTIITFCERKIAKQNSELEMLY